MQEDKYFFRKPYSLRPPGKLTILGYAPDLTCVHRHYAVSK